MATIDDLIAKKEAFDDYMLERHEAPISESQLISDFMGVAIELIATLEEQMANRMLCKNYKEK